MCILAGVVGKRPAWCVDQWSLDIDFGHLALDEAWMIHFEI